MTQEEYIARHERIVEDYGSNNKEAGARREQELARLYVESGWDIRRLAKQEQMSKSMMAYQIQFGRFVNWYLSTNGGQRVPIPERAFRGYWLKTDSNLGEIPRFEEVKAMIEANSDKPPTPRGKNLMVKRLLTEFGDGEFHAVRVMATKLDVPQEKLLTTLDGMRLHGFHDTEAERRRAPATDGGWRYRLRPHRGHVVPYDTLREELAPLLEELRYQGKQDQYKLAPIVFTNMAHKIEQALEKLAR